MSDDPGEAESEAQARTFLECLEEVCATLDGPKALAPELEGALDRDADPRRFLKPALPLLDRLLRDWQDDVRWLAVRALRPLSLELATPFLHRSCSDPVPAVAELAREILLERGVPQAVADDLLPLPDGILEAPPSEELLSRLEILAGRDVEERHRLRNVLLAEVGAGEGNAEHAALLAILFCERKVRTPLPDLNNVHDDYARWMVALHSHLGAPLERALFSLWERFDPADENGPLLALCALYERGELEEARVEEVRVRLLRNSAEGRADRSGVLKVLSRLGAPAADWEPVYDLLGHEEWGSFARNALAHGPATPAVEARLERDLASVSNPEREIALLELGIIRKLPRAIVPGVELVRGATSKEEVTRALVVVRRLVAAGALKAAELLPELDHPESPRFALAMAVLPRRSERTARMKLALRRAFIGPHPEAAGLVLLRFLAENETSPADPRLPQVLSRVSKEARAYALTCLAFGSDVELAPFEAHFLEALTSGDEEFEYLEGLLAETAAGREILKKAQARSKF